MRNPPRIFTIVNRCGENSHEENPHEESSSLGPFTYYVIKGGGGVQPMITIDYGGEGGGQFDDYVINSNLFEILYL